MEKLSGVDIKYFSKNLLDCHIQYGDFSFFVSYIYGESVMKYRPRLLERITRIGIQRKDSWDLMNFNDILHNGEKVGGPCRNEFTFDHFVNMIKACQMVELPSHGNGYTWGGMRCKKQYIQCKLDCGFGNKEWYKIFPVQIKHFWKREGLIIDQS